MIPEIGQFSLILALCMAVAQTALPVAGIALKTPSLLATARYAASAQFLFLGISFLCLTYAFIAYDFSVYYVIQNSNSALPLMYRISGVWGAHEGSLLLWVLMLGGWTAAVAWFSREVPDSFLARVLAVLGVVSIGFLLFLILTSNPFARTIPAAVEGRDLNPLLQDPGLVFHPPMLYMGYVGFSVAFAFAVAALISGRLDAAWARWSKPWTNMAWVFLTLGIALGSWWAYYELGWGGWWFWDPVENASFMPWLVGTALIHSLSATEKRGLFKSWTVSARDADIFAQSDRGIPGQVGCADVCTHICDGSESRYISPHSDLPGDRWFTCNLRVPCTEHPLQWELFNRFA